MPFKMLSATFLGILSLYSASVLSTYKDASSAMTWETKFLLFTSISSAYPTLVGASVNVGEATKLKEKIKEGTKLLEEMNLTLKKIKEDLSSKEPMDKKNLEKIMQIKEKFKKLQMDPTDLSMDLLEKFRESTMEAFELVVKSLGVGPIPALEKLKETFKFRPHGDEL